MDAGVHGAPAHPVQEDVVGPPSLVDDESEAAPVSADFDAPAAEVFQLLIDADRYPSWLVGAQHIRSVDDRWPAPGAGFDHLVGFGPFEVAGRTVALEVDPPRRLVLEAGIGWMGRARVVFELAESANGTWVTMLEKPSAGPLRYVWDLGGAGLMRQLLWGRNQVSLDQLRDEQEQASTPVRDR
jgi:uncharacterized protein YndB with AHSA1/START domain